MVYGICLLQLFYHYNARNASRQVGKNLRFVEEVLYHYATALGPLCQTAY